MTNFDVSVRARFVNQIGAGAKGAERDLKNVANAAKAIGRVDFGTRLRAQFQGVVAGARVASEQIERLGKVVAGVGAGVEAMRRILATPAIADADFGDKLVDIAQKAEISKDKIGDLSAEVKAMADQLRSSPISIGKGIDVLMGSGLSFDVSKSLIPPIQKVAKAYRVETDAVSNAVFSMVNNLKVAPKDVEVALGRISQSAADGRYEIANYAAGMPDLSALFQANNQTGLKGVSRMAAAVQTIAGVVGTPGQADAALQDFLQKSTSDEVLKDFKKAGVKGLDKRLAKARKNGDDIIPIISEALQKATKGDAGLIPRIFADKEAQKAARALGSKEGLDDYLAKRDRYDKIVTPDKLNSDLDLRLGAAGNTYRTFSERWDALMTALGKGVNGYLAPAVELFGQLADHITRAAEAMPKLAGAIVMAGAAFAGVTAFKTITGVLGKLGTGASAAASATTGGAAAATAGATAATAETAIATTAARGGLLEALLGRLMTSPAGAGAGFLGLGWMATKVMDLATHPPAWTVKDRAEGEERLADLQARRAEVAKRIEDITSRSKVPEMAETLTAPLRTQLADFDNQIRVIQEEMAKIDGTTATPKINLLEIERAIQRLQELQGQLRGVGPSPSFMDNAAPSPKAGGDKQSSTPSNRTYNVAGYSPAVVARRIAREERRAARETQFGALHDLGALA